MINVLKKVDSEDGAELNEFGRIEIPRHRDIKEKVSGIRGAGKHGSMGKLIKKEGVTILVDLSSPRVR